MRKAFILSAFAAAALVVFAAPAHASSVPALDQMVQAFKTQASTWAAPLRRDALDLFGLLAVIEMACALIPLAFKRPDFGDLVGEFVHQIMYLGFFLAALQFSVTWATEIVNSFRQAAVGAGGGGISPTDVFATGIDIAGKVLNEMSFWHPADSAAFMIAALVLMVVFALIAAEMIRVLVSAWIIIYLGVLFMGFGALRYTKDFAVSTLRYTVSIGARLFVLQLLVGIGAHLAQQWAGSFQASDDVQLLVMIGCSIVLLAIVKTVPQEVQGIINGSHMVHGGGAVIGAAAAVGAGVAAGAAAVAGAPVAAAQAARLAAAQISASPQASSGGAIAKAAALAGGTARNLAGAAASDIGRRMAGGGAQGSAAWRMASDLGAQRRPLDQAAAKAKDFSTEKGNKS